MVGSKKMHAMCTAKKAQAKEKEEKKAKEENCKWCNPKGKEGYFSRYDWRTSCETCGKDIRMSYLSKLGLSTDQDNLPNIKIAYDKIISQAHSLKNMDQIHEIYIYLKSNTFQ